MPGQVLRVLLAIVVALAASMPVGSRAMPMPSAGNGMASNQPCSNCPRQPGHMKPAGMPACEVLVCAGPPAVLPAPVFAREPAFSQVVFASAPPAHWTEARPAPDPFPPRSIVLL
jgi:hypothetical protein